MITMERKAQPSESRRVMRGNRSCGVKFLSYQGSGRKEIWLREWEFLPDSVIMCYFFPLSDGARGGGGGWVGKSYLEGVLKEIHVGINPDIIESAPLPSSPCSPHIPSICALQC